MSPMRGRVLELCLLALNRGVVPRAMLGRLQALIESFPSDSADPQVLIAHGILTQAQLNALLAEAEREPQGEPPAPAGGSPQGAAPAGTGFPRKFGDDFTLVEVIGEGGMGVVYKAWQKSLRRHVALKIIRPSVTLSKKQIERFQAEARAAARLHHPHIVSVHQVGAHENDYYFTMDLISGPPLSTLIAEGRLSRTRAIELIEKIARAVHYAHEQGIIHRDLKPGNILVDARGEPFVADFGLAKDLETSLSLSFTHGALGTPSYMSPEQARGEAKRADARSDVYSLGATLYEMLVGRPPFKADSVHVLLRMIVEDDPPPLRQVNRKIPADVEAICLKCLAKDPEQRYQTAKELADDLRRYLKQEPVVARQGAPLYSFHKYLRLRRREAGVLAIVALTAAVVLIWARASRGPGSASQAPLYGLDPRSGEGAFRITSLTDRSRRRRCVAAFLDGPHLGRLAVFDDHAREVWRRDLAGPSLYTSTSVVQRVNSLLAEDVRPEPGTEIVTASSLLKRSDAEAGGASEEEGQASIFSEDGTLLGELWHPGPIEGVVSLGGQNPRLLVFWGRNAEVWKTMGGSQSNVSYQAIFCVRADQLAGQAPPHHAPGVPRAKLLWYKVIKQGVAFSHVKRIPLGPDGETLEVRTNKSDTLFLNDQGKVVCDQTSSGEFRKNPPSCLRSVGVESGAEE